MKINDLVFGLNNMIIMENVGHWVELKVLQKK